jgi:hypothetical protein
MRHAARTDANQAEIVKALKSVGISVEYIKLPFDLVVFNPRKSETAFVECKTEDGRLTKTQVDFIARWAGKIYIVRGAEDAVRQVLGEEVLT